MDDLANPHCRGICAEFKRHDTKDQPKLIIGLQ
jgi:hypothetical protein